MRIDISQLKKHYGSRRIIDLEALQLESGKILGLTGVNGAGKTTLLRILAGLDNNYEGKIYYDQQLGLTTESRQQVTYLSQKPYMMKGSVRENIAYPLLLRKMELGLIKTKTDCLMEELGLQSLAEQHATLLSGGEAQKVALARALIFEPKLLLLDEPTASIDAQTITHIENTLKKRNQDQHMTMVMISHDRKQLAAICDTLLEMEGGTCIQSAL